MFLDLLETLIILIFETWFSVFSPWPRRIFRVQDSAVLILNAEDGVGRSAALKYSELGYTVFALCPDHQRGTPITTREPPGVSSILYSWHLKKERSPYHPWGLVAPITVDTSSKADRLRAYETVKAYCFDHSLHLTALIAFPPIYENSSEPNSPHSASVISADHSTHPAAKFLPLSFSKDVVWQDSVFREITEPVLIIQEYIMLLKECSGRVIIVSGCSQGRFLAGCGFNSTLDDARRSVAHTFGCELEPIGIRVSSLVSGLLATPTSPTQRILDKPNICAKKIDPDFLDSLSLRVPLAVQNMLRSFAIREEDLFAVIHGIMSSRHPKADYYVGIHPFVHNALNVLPLAAFRSAQRWIG